MICLTVGFPDEIARKALTQGPPFFIVIIPKDHKFTPAETSQVFIGTSNICFNFMVSEFFGRRRGTFRNNVISVFLLRNDKLLYDVVITFF